MEFVSNMTRKQKEQYVIDLYKQDKKIREIAERTHMGFRDIGAIIKRIKLEVERERGQLEEKDDYDTESKSQTTQAIKMFSEGKTPVDVVIELDLPADEVREIYRQFLELKNMYKLIEVYDEMQNYLPSLLELFRIIESRGLNKNDIVDVLMLINTGQVPFLQKKVANLTSAASWLENEIKKKEYNLSVLDNRTKELKYRGDCTYRGYREDSMYPISSVHSTMAFTYSKDDIYPNIEDKSIRPVSTNIRLTRRNDFSSNCNLIDSLATEVVDAWADRKQIS
jgi:hypothetical protein